MTNDNNQLQHYTLVKLLLYKLNGLSKIKCELREYVSKENMKRQFYYKSEFAIGLPQQRSLIII